MLNLYNNTNINNIILSLNTNIYSIKQASFTFNNKKNWNVNDFNYLEPLSIYYIMLYNIYI
jgi:hypothetical protein